jgi:energy-converting hydrogenase B subunit D
MIFVPLVILLVLFSLLAVHFKDLIYSVIFLASSSLTLALLFFILQAPDIAITEAAVNAGLATLIYVIVIRKTRRFEE